VFDGLASPIRQHRLCEIVGAVDNNLRYLISRYGDGVECGSETPLLDFRVHAKHDVSGRSRACLGGSIIPHDASSAALAFDEMLSELSAARERESADQFELARVSRLTTMGAMTASIAHEINQPLAAIAANANAGLRWLSRQTPDLEEVHAALKRINTDAHRASEVIQGIRSIFKKAPQQGALIDINDVVLEVLALVHGELINYRVSAISNLLPSLPRVRADRVQLQQVILNLIMNAVEAMGTVADGARVLNVASQLDEPNAVLVTVQDTGPGIDPNRMDRIFDAFFSTKSSGMGMGLFICRSIVESHGGRLWATAAVPQGAMFHLVLPIGDTAAG
jgi:C4-dicarboxylate-specific signal transduction histidine kinase